MMAAPAMAANQPQVSALSPHGRGKNTALWQVVGPPSWDMHTAGQRATKTTAAATHGITLRTFARYIQIRRAGFAATRSQRPELPHMVTPVVPT